MNNSKLRLNTKKTVIAIVFGITGFLVNFLSIDFMQFPDFKVSLLFGLIFPMLIALFWGWRYGLISALAGGCQTMWVLWYSDGYGILYSVPVFTLWIVWHGWWADVRRTAKRRWFHSMYVMELVFRIFAELGFLTIFRGLVSLNPPFWDNSITNNHISLQWVFFVARKHLIESYILLLLSDIFLHIKPLRRVFGYKPDNAYTQTTYIMSGSLLAGFLYWLFLSLMDYHVFFPGSKSFLDIAFVNIPTYSLFVRNVSLIIFLGAGLILSRLYLRLNEKQMLIQKNQARFKTFLDTSPDAIFILNTKAEISYLNKSAENAFDQSAEMTGKSIYNFVAPGYLDIVRENFLQGLKGKVTEPYEVAMLTSKSQQVFFEIHAAAITEPDGSILGRIALLRDISRRLEIEKQIGEKNQFLNNIMETNPNAVTIVDKAGKIIYANRKAEEVLRLKQLSAQELIYNDPKFKITDENGNPFSDDMLPFNIVRTEKKAVYNIQHRIETESGEQRYLRINAAPVLDEKGQFIYMIANVEDITDKRASDQELEEYRKNLETLVVERTAELELQNETLQKYLKMFEKREFKIKELKTQLKNMEEKIEKKN